MFCATYEKDCLLHWSGPLTQTHGAERNPKTGLQQALCILNDRDRTLHGRVALKAFSKRGRRLDQVPVQRREPNQRRRKMGPQHHPLIWFEIPHRLEWELGEKNHKTLGIPPSGKSP